MVATSFWLLVVVFTALLVGTEAAYAVVPVERLAGPTRFETAIAVSKTSYPGAADAVVLATGRNWPDALGGAALAGAVDGPVLLCEYERIPSAVLAEITRLDPATVYVLGGTGAIADSALVGLASSVPSATVTDRRS